MKALLGFASVAAVLVTVLLLHGAGSSSSSSSPFSIAAAMAAAKCPDITDTNTHPLPYGALPTASLDARTCAIDFGIPAGAPGAQGPAGAQGTNGVSGYTRMNEVKSVKTTSSATHNWAGIAKCPPGTKVIGGGASLTTDGGKSFPGVAITASEPTANGQSWTATAIIPPGMPPGKLKVAAICAKVS